MSSGATGAAPAGTPGKDLFVEAIKLSLEKGSGIPAMPLLQKALALGLTPGDEVFARHALGEAYREIFGNSGLPWRQMVETNEFHQGMTEIEKAFELDRVGSLGYFSQPLNIGRLKHLDLMYTLAADAQKERDGNDAAIDYLAGKLRAVDYLARPPLLQSLLKLAELYREVGAFEETGRCLREVVNTEPLYPADQEHNEEVRGRARQMLSEIQRESQKSVAAPSTSAPQKRGTNVTQPGADVHLKRAYGFIQEVERATEDFRQRAIAHDAQVESEQPFVQGMVATIRGNQRLKQQKASLVNDLQLANQEIDRAVSLDRDATVDTADGTFTALQLRAFVTYMNGQLEMIWGRAEDAKRLLTNSLQMVELPDAHYMLGLLHESDYQPAEALNHFERCLELDPAGELSVSALREANAMRNYKKKFRGNWLLFIFLLFLYIVPGVIYFWKKYK